MANVQTSLNIRWKVHLAAQGPYSSSIFHFEGNEWQLQCQGGLLGELHLYLNPIKEIEAFNDSSFSASVRLVGPGAKNVTPCNTKIISLRNRNCMYAYVRTNIFTAQFEDLRRLLPGFPQLTFRVVLGELGCESEDDIDSDKSVQTAAYIIANPHLSSFSDLVQELVTDVEFQCSDQVVKAHKAVLGLRSPVFKKMLNSKMTEGKTGKVKITDMTSNILHQFIQYLYSGTLTELTVESAKALYEAGDKYAVDGLAVRCAEFLTDNMTQQNACELLLLADAHSDDAFKEAVFDFIVNRKIPLLDVWLTFSKTHTSLALEATNRLCRKMFASQDETL